MRILIALACCCCLQNELSALELMGYNPEIGRLTLMRGGMSSSEIHRIDFPFKSYVLRKLSNSVSLDKRKAELDLHKILAENGFAPQIAKVDNQEDPQKIIMDYIYGRNFNPDKDLRDDAIIDQIVDIARFIHKSENLDIHVPSMMEYIKSSLKSIEENNTIVPSKFFKWAFELFWEYRSLSIEKVPIHGDLSPGNIIISHNKKVYFIDFQEARRDSVFAEFGYFFYESGIDLRHIIKSVMARYFRRDITDSEWNLILFYMKATAFLCGIYRLDWIDPKYSAKDLDEMLKNLKERGIDFFKRGDYDKIDLEEMDSEKRTCYVLSFFKDYEDMKVK